MKIRLTINQLKQALNFVQKDLKEGHHFEPMFIFYKMMYLQEAFHFVLSPRQQKLEQSYRKYFDPKYMNTAAEVEPFVPELRKLEASGLLIN